VTDGKKSDAKRPRRLGRGLAGLIPTGAGGRSAGSSTSVTRGEEIAEPPALVDIRTDASTRVVDTPAREETVTSGAAEIEIRAPHHAKPQVQFPAGTGTDTEPASGLADGVPRGTSVAGEEASRHEELEYLDPSMIEASPHQPREYFDQEAIEKLAASIKASGLIQPIVVRRIGHRIELVAGERRLRASKLAGLPQIPAIVRQLSERQTAEWALVENLQREDLNPLERARGLRRLIDEFSLTHQQAAEAVGMERASVSNLLRLLDLDETTASLVARGTLGQGHAKVLLSVSDLTLRSELCQAIVARNWSVRRLEVEVRRLLAPPSMSAPTATISRERGRTQQIDKLERELSEHLGTRVQISLSRQEGQGRLLIDFHSLEHFDDLMDRFGFNTPAD
jgi:ParB family chromosome partitioning protein